MRRRYNRKGWPLTLCVVCARTRYCEPHGTTADCVCCGKSTESEPIPYRFGASVIVISAADRQALIFNARGAK